MFQRCIACFVDIRENEATALKWSWLYSFSLLLCYYILRPIRDDLGVNGGVHNLPWLFTGTLITMILLNPVFGYLVKRWPREKFVAIAYRFFALNLVIFSLALVFSTATERVWVGRVFFIWVSVFNLFVVSVFWSLVDDVFSSEQGKRLFGFLAAGATLGGVAGALATSVVVELIGQSWMLILSAILLEFGIFAARKLLRNSPRFIDKDATSEEIIKGGGIISGLVNTFKSPYLLGIAGFILFYSVTSTFLYFQQGSIAQSDFHNNGARTVFFAHIDLWVNIITFILQMGITGRLTRWLGVALIISILPLVSVLGFGSLLVWPSVVALILVQVVRRVSNFAFARPTREILFTVIPQEDRYKAKNFIDTVVYRSGDQIGSWSYVGLTTIGLGATGVVVVAIPLSVAWLLLSLWLGWRHHKIEQLC